MLRIQEDNIVHARREQVTDVSLCTEAKAELLNRFTELREKIYRLHRRNLERDLERSNVIRASERVPKLEKARFELMALLRAKPDDIRVIHSEITRHPMHVSLDCIRGGDGEITDEIGIAFSPEISTQIFGRLEDDARFAVLADLLWHRAMFANASMQLIANRTTLDLDELCRMNEERNGLTIGYYRLLDEYRHVIEAEGAYPEDDA